MTTTNHSTVTSDEAADSRSPSVRRPSLPHPHDNHNDGDENNPQTFLYVILFYKYHTLSTNRIVMEQYQTILYNLCRKLHLSGRILIGTGSCSNSEATTDNNNNEGINGTLAGQYHDLLAFTHALLYYHRKEIPDIERTDCYPIFNEDDDDHNDENHIQQQQQQRRRLEAMEEFWNQSAQFFTTITTTASVVAIPPSSFELRMTSPDDFKWSRVATTTTNTDTQSVLYTSNMSDINMNHNNNDDDHQDTNLTNASNTSSSSSLFPDLHIKLVSELIGTGCPEFQQIPIEETSIGYLTPQEWHEHLSAIYQTTTALQESHDDPTTTTTTTTTKNCNSNNHNNAIIIDCRNTKEYQIGHFQDAIHPNMTTFAQFVPWVERNRILLQQKPKIYMYCTGGIRCEKASAYIRRTVPNVQQVYHLKGGIHKYLEQYGTNPTNVTAPVVASTNYVGNDNINVEMGTSTTTSTITPPIWKGRNFVFDGRGSIMPSSIVNPKIHSGPSVDPDTTTNGNDVDKTVTANIVGQCAYCQSPYDQFDPHCVCTVCREPILVCIHCQTITAGTFRDPDRTLNDDDDTIRSTSTIIHEYHCGNHQHLQNCYYTNLNMFTVAELQHQLIKLKQHMATIAIGRRYKQKRKTLQKQMVRIQDRMDELHYGDSSSMIRDDPQPQEYGILNNDLPCRNCGTTDCIDGRCWGFYGLKRKERLEGGSGNVNDTALKEPEESDQCGTIQPPTEEKSLNIKIIPLLHQLPAQPKRSKHTKNNKRRNDAAIDEMMQLNIAVPPSKYRDDGTGIRVPPCCTRVVQCTTKAKWYGQSVLKVIQNEFTELAKPDVLNDVVSHGLLRLNGKSISFNELPSLSLKGSDTLGRIIHWHEAPVLVPMTIDVERCIVPSVVLKEYGADSEDTGTIFICNKPSSVPTHPAGPYLFNTLTMMVEGQEGLPPQSLYPLHRTDRVTSGLTLCSTSVAVSRAFQRCLTNGNVDKMYLAKVDGNFALTGKDVQQLKNNWKYDIGFCEWSDDGKFVIVDAPIYTSDPAAGIRSINKLGKPSKSYFQHLYYDKESHTTVILCCPITGRNHQLRVHLQAIGFPIINDIQYGGRSDINPSRSCDKNAAIDAMIHVRDTASENKERRVSSLTERDVASAKKACKCCRVSDRDGISTSFTKAQLLMEGHSICLHAYRYKVCIFPPKSTKATDQLTELKFQVRAPTWTNEAYLQNVSWLATS